MRVGSVFILIATLIMGTSFAVADSANDIARYYCYGQGNHFWVWKPNFEEFRKQHASALAKSADWDDEDTYSGRYRKTDKYERVGPYSPWKKAARKTWYLRIADELLEKKDCIPPASECACATSKNIVWFIPAYCERQIQTSVYNTITGAFTPSPSDPDTGIYRVKVRVGCKIGSMDGCPGNPGGSDKEIYCAFGTPGGY